MANRNDKFSAWVSWLTMLLGVVGVLCLFVATGLTVTNAILRSFFSSPITGASELVELVGLIAVVCFIPLSLESNHHLEIDFVAGYFGRNAYRLSGLFGSLVTLMFLAMIVWQLWDYSMRTLTSGDTTYFLAIATWPYWVASTVILAVGLPVQIIAMRRNWTREGAESGAPNTTEIAEADFEDARI